jgi:hypothetical protein
MIVIYCLAGLVAGCVSEKWRLFLKMLLVLAGMLWAIVINSWSAIDWDAGTAMSTLFSGVYAYALPAMLLFGVPFVIGMYLTRALRTALSKKAR